MNISSHLTLGADDAVSPAFVAELVGKSHGDLDKKNTKPRHIMTKKRLAIFPNLSKEKSLYRSTRNSGFMSRLGYGAGTAEICCRGL